jgi:hypothetical protein
MGSDRSQEAEGSWDTERQEPGRKKVGTNGTTDKRRWKTQGHEAVPKTIVQKAALPPYWSGIRRNW